MVKKYRHNFIIAAVCVAGIMLSLLWTLNRPMGSVALEQQVRCGIEPHAHTDACYSEDLLVCKQVAHGHDENCYLVLLEENDINTLLHYLDDAEEPSLEYVITDTVRYALRLNTDLNSAPAEELPPLDRPAVEALNATLTKNPSSAALTLNENLNTYELIQLQQEEEFKESGTTNAPVTLAATENPDTSYYKLNIYVYLDDQWQCIGNISYSQNYRVTTATLMNHINQQLGTDLTSSDIKLYYSTNQQYNRSVTVKNTTTFTLSRVYGSAVYARVVSASANSNSSTALAFYTVTFTYPDGTVHTEYVRKGGTVTLPEGQYIWNDGTRDYAAGETVTISKKIDFIGTMEGPITSVHIIYDLNFPTVKDVTVSTKPTIAGSATSTLSQTLSEGLSTTVANASQTDVKGSIDGNTTGLSRVIHFTGWRIGTSDVILTPNTQLIWEELVQYSSGGVLRLNGVWESEPEQTASFFVRYDSVAVDTEGSIGGQDQNHYTNELFASFVGGTEGRSYSELEQYGIADSTSDNSYGADQAIRALYGAEEKEVYLTSFPTDEYIFEQLKSYAENKKLSIPTEDGGTELVDPADLNSNAYAIRWYVFKAQSDAWHIDGKLLKKEGLLHVSKTFAGNAELVAQAKSDFYIEAANEERSMVHTLTLENPTSYDPATDTYLWEIENIEYGERWTVTEFSSMENTEEADYSVYADYTVRDASGGQSRNGIGTTVSVQGETYEMDKGDTEVLRVAFTNIYNKKNSIIIKKQDAATGNALEGATFRLWQNETPLTFRYNETTKSYEYDEAGTITLLSGSNNGYFELLVEDFSYTLGPVTVEETAAPDGYTASEKILIGYTDDTQTTIGILEGGSGMAVYQDGILLVGNGAAIADVTAQKKWDCPESDRAAVTVQLLANDRLITHLLGNVEPSAVLTAENNWSHTWVGLPTYIDGTAVTYSIREIQVGSEQCKADYTFPNWIVSYDAADITFTESGETKILLTVTNTAKRTLLRVHKLNLTDHSRVEGAVFTLEAMLQNGTVDPNAVAKTGTSDADGTLVFDNLKTNLRYRLTEIQAPDGYYFLKEPIYLTIQENGTVTVEEHPYAEASSNTYNMTVYNQPRVPLPASGGGGTLIYSVFGLLLMLTAGVYIYRKPYGKEVSDNQVSNIFKK